MSLESLQVRDEGIALFPKLFPYKKYSYTPLNLACQYALLILFISVWMAAALELNVRHGLCLSVYSTLLLLVYSLLLREGGGR